jgi:hypothetical protein
MQITTPDTADLAIDPKRETRNGNRTVKLMMEGVEGALDNYAVFYEKSLSDVTHPRHRHTFEQFRLPLNGEFIYAKDKTIPAGSIAYFPAGVHYGPEVRPAGYEGLVFQLGGASRHGYISKRQRYLAYDALVKKGKFDTQTGVYTWVDEKGQKHNQDAFEATWEQAFGKDWEYPKARYNEIITMDPRNYEWVPDPTQPGVAVKAVGAFTEANTQIGFVRIDKSATFNAGLRKRVEILFLLKGSVTCGGKQYPEHTTFGFEGTEGKTPITASEPSELVYVVAPDVNPKH